MPSIAETRRMIKRATKRIPEKFPEKGRVIFRDGNLADVQVDKSPTLLKNCKIIGDPEMIVVGQVVSLKWEDNPGGTKSPTILASGAGEGANGAGLTIPAAIVDDLTIENSTYGLRVKAGGLDLKHLSFTPAMSGHTHKDSLTGAGWKVTADGIIISPSDATRIHPDGMLALGTQPDILKLSSGNATYRMWVGNNDPASAPFSITKQGAIKATAGDIASWNIGTDRIYADSGKANIVGSNNPWIGLGTMTEFAETGTEGVWMGRDPNDNIYKLYLGKPEGDHMYWDGDVLYITGVYEGVLNVEETWADTFTINSNLDDVTPKLILGRPGPTNAEFSWSGTAVGINRTTSITGGLTTTDDVAIDADTLYVDTTEDKVYINAGTLPTYRGALTVKPAANNEKGVVVQALSGQSQPLIEVYNSSNTVVFRAASNGDLESGNFFRGVTGWTIEGTGDAEFNNIVARGEIRASIFTLGEIQANAGTLGVFYSASKLNMDCTTASTLNGTFTLEADNGNDEAMLFAVDDIIRLKSWSGTSMKDAWGQITARTDHSSYATYTVQLKAGSTSSTFRKGTAIADYGPSGSGFITLSADGTVGSSPNLTMATHSGSPWSAISSNVRLGNLNGVLGIATDEHGLAFGKDMSSTTQPYGIFSDAQAVLKGITQSWWNSRGTVVGGIDPDATDAEPLFWLGPSSANKRMVLTASGLLALKSGVYIGSYGQDSVMLSGGILWLPFGGGPWSSSYGIDLTNLIDYGAPTSSASSVRGFGARYGWGPVIGSASTNYVENPNFNANVTDGWSATTGTGTVTWSNAGYYAGPGLCKIQAGTTETYIQTDGTGASVPNNSTVYAQCRLLRKGSSSSVRLQIRDTSAGVTRATATSTVEDEYELLVCSWTNTTGSAKTCQVRLSNNANDSTTYGLFDVVQLEIDKLTPFFHGGMGGDYSFSGTSHSSTSIRGSNGSIKYPLAFPSSWTVSFWVNPTQMPNEPTSTNPRMFEWAYDANNRVNMYYDYATDDLVAVWRGNSTNKTLTGGAAHLTRGEWHHICLTYDGTTMFFYINGTLVDSATGVTAMATAPNYMYIGCDASLASTFSGVFDDFIVLDTAITAETVALLTDANYPAVCIGQTELNLHTNGMGRLRATPIGLFAHDANGNAALGLSLNNDQPVYGGMTLSEGDLIVGHNKVGSSAMMWDNSEGQLKFLGNGSATAKVYVDTDGTLMAGGGAVWMNDDGLALDALQDPGVTYASGVTWYNGATPVSTLYTYDSTWLSSYWKLEGGNEAHTMGIISQAPATYQSTIDLAARSSTTASSITIQSDSDSSYKYISLSVGGTGNNLNLNGDAYVAGGMRVGSYGTGLANDDLWIDNDVRIQNGLYVGDLGQDPASGVIIADTDIYTVNWTNYSATSTVTGWSSTTTKVIYYKRIGKMMFVKFYISGTSNSTSTSFTLPYPCNSNLRATGAFRGADNGTYAFRLYELLESSSTVGLYPTAGGGNWTASGTKTVIGEFFYQTT